MIPPILNLHLDLVKGVRHVSPEMKFVTESKFRAWDYIVKNNILEKGTAREKRRAYSLLLDPTIYAYAFMRNPNGTPFKLYSYQDLIINDNHNRVIFSAANQAGKSLMLCLKALSFSLLNPNTTVLMVSKTLPQSKDLLRQIKSLLQSSILDYKYDVGDSETKTEIYFRHYEEVSTFDKVLGKEITKLKELPQSRIICVPATGGALGYAVNLALVDELAFYEDGDYFYKQILQPRTYTTKGQIIVFSNPNGQQGIFWELWNSPRFHKYSFDFLDCPTNTQEEFDELSAELTREQIDSTLLAKFTNPEGGFLTFEERSAMQEDRMNVLPTVLTQPVYIFFDFAKVNDRTVRVIGVPYGTEDIKGVYVYEMKEYPQGKPYTEIIDELNRLIQDLGIENVAMVGWDNSGVGAGIEDDIKKISGLGIQCTPVNFSLERKAALYTNFKLLIERNLRGAAGVKIPKVKECNKQLSMLRFKKSSRGYLQVHHEKENDRDDFPDALAGLCSLIANPSVVPVSATIVTADNSDANDTETYGFVSRA